jgi:hypothetical protein
MAGSLITQRASNAVQRSAAIAKARFELPRRGEVIATIAARCDECAWDAAGREAVVLAISVDGRYAQHLPLVRTGPAEYRVMLGQIDAAAHTVSITIDRHLTARELHSDTTATIERIAIAPVLHGSPEYIPLSLAPFLYARANTLGRFTDTPVLMWYETEPTSRGTRYRYSVIFTNEDGGTPTDRLMATWGRTTDIEYVYSVEVNQAGAILADDLQGPHHEILPFRGKREGRHPLLWVTTDNNMVRDEGTTTVRYAPAPIAFLLQDMSREAVMDANPWLYALAAQELKREGKIVDDSAPGRGVITDPRRFLYAEACGEVGDAALAMAVRLGDTWLSSDRGVPEYRVVRNGCFRVAIPLPVSAASRDVRAVRVQAFADAASRGRPSIPARVHRVNKVFMLDDQSIPGTSLLHWEGSAWLQPDGPPLEIEIR